MSSSPVLKQFAGMWTLMQQPSAAAEWTPEQKIQEAKARGFEAIGSGTVPQLAELSRAHGLDYVCYIDASAETWRDRLERAKAVSPARVNVQLGNHDTLPAEAAAVWEKMWEGAREIGLEIDLEVHRDTCTETPEKVEEICRLFQEATGEEPRICWDFSHFAVVKHLNPPYADRLLDHPDRIQRARQLHLRPFNGHHAQIPATDGHGQETPEFKRYLEFVDALLACWLRGAQDGAVLYACPEFGPVASGYGLSAFPDVWQDAVYLRERVATLWQENLKRLP